MAEATEHAVPFRNRIIGYAQKPADQFQANPANWRKHPERQRLAVNASLSEIGWIAAVIENVQTGNLIDGHERVWQALQTGEEVPYLKVSLTEQEEALALAIFDPISAMAQTDPEALSSLLSSISVTSEPLQELLDRLTFSATPLEGGGAEFQEFDLSIPTDHACPKCGYSWSGKA